MKFEEDVEEGGRWSKPYVATLSLHSLFELRSMLLNGTVCLEVNGNSLEEIADAFLDTMVISNQVKNYFYNQVIQCKSMKYLPQHSLMDNSTCRAYSCSIYPNPSF